MQKQTPGDLACDQRRSLKKEIPEHQRHIYAERRARFALVIPVLNEGGRIRSLLSEMSALGSFVHADIILADGNSTDGSLTEEFLRANHVRALLVKTGPGRLSAQLRMAYAFCLEESYSGIITIDGNGKDAPESIPDFAAALDQGFDYVQASRFIKGGRGVRTPPIRHLAIRLIHAPLTSLAGRRWITDSTQGFRAYSARYLEDERVQPFREAFMGYELLAYLAIRAGQIGCKVKELPTARVYPESGPIPTKISGWRGSLDLLK